MVVRERRVGIAPIAAGAHARRGRGALEIRGRRLVWGERTYVMGIVNVTPDSFSGDGTPSAEDARARAMSELAAGADIIDVGAESTRPGATPVDAATEAARLVPAVEAIRRAAPAAIVSLDTFKPDVFARAHAAGGDMLNSIWGLDGALLHAASAAGVPVVIMHNTAVALYERAVVDEVLASLVGAAVRAERAGIAHERIILDPGIGFGKTPEHNLAVLAALDRLVALGYPTLVGTSRKSTIGKLTGRPVNERGYGTAATLALAVAAGIDIVRVHDVPAALDAVRTSDAVVRGWRPDGWTDAPGR